MRYLVVGICFLWLLAAPTLGFYDPRDRANNKVGIHILEPHDVPLAKTLVNEPDGAWGYVTLVIREDQRSKDQWQPVFESLRQAKLIPIVRVATRFENGVWIKPRREDLESWRSFFDSLDWVVANRYIILFNEPNHAKEWQGRVDPASFAALSRHFVETMRQSQYSYTLLPAALDLAAPNGPITMHPLDFWAQVAKADPDWFKLFDAWNSHSYPNPGFAGKVSDTSLQSIRGYRREMEWLSRFGLDQSLPIFITETGWQQQPGLSNETIGTNLIDAFTKVWLQDDQVVAVTPFLLSYPAEPFSDFALVDESLTPKPQYHTLASLSKVAGNPVQYHSATFEPAYLPKVLPATTDITVPIKLTNTGQSIWEPGITRLVAKADRDDRVEVGEVPYTLPGKSAMVTITITANATQSPHGLELSLVHNQDTIEPTLRHEFSSLDSKSLPGRVRWFIESVRLRRLVSSTLSIVKQVTAAYGSE